MVVRLSTRHYKHIKGVCYALFFAK